MRRLTLCALRSSSQSHHTVYSTCHTGYDSGNPQTRLRPSGLALNVCACLILPGVSSCTGSCPQPQSRRGASRCYSSPSVLFLSFPAGCANRLLQDVPSGVLSFLARQNSGHLDIRGLGLGSSGEPELFVSGSPDSAL